MGIEGKQNRRWSRKLVGTFCNSCHRQTCHDVLKSDLRTEIDQAGPGAEFNLYWLSEFVKCRGCQTTKLLVRHADDAHLRPETEKAEPNLYWKEISYPANLLRVRPKWTWIPSSKLPNEYKLLFSEIYKAIDVRALTLASIGIRTIIDRFAIQKIGDVGTFEDKLATLLEKGIITQIDKRFLSVVIDAGSAAAHRGQRFMLDQVFHMMDSAEHLLQTHFIFDAPNRELRKATPRRPRRPRRKSS